MFQDIGARIVAREHAEAVPHNPSGPAAHPPAAQAASLIARYPNLREPDVTRLIDLYRHLPALDAALIMSDEKLGPKLDHFFSDHGYRIKTPFRQYAVLMAIAATGVLLTAYALLIS